MNKQLLLEKTKRNLNRKMNRAEVKPRIFTDLEVEDTTAVILKPISELKFYSCLLPFEG